MSDNLVSITAGTNSLNGISSRTRFLLITIALYVARGLFGVTYPILHKIIDVMGSLNEMSFSP
jgi:hypothetical protein